MKPDNLNQIISNIFEVEDNYQFNELAIQIFHLQYKNVKIYRDYCDAVVKTPFKIRDVSEIPFLPIQFFKSNAVIWDSLLIENTKTFKSSGTTSTGRSQHFVTDLKLYEKSFSLCFEQFYGKPEDITIVALLPSYQEQGYSSLVYMVENLISKSNDKRSGFYLNDKNIVSLLETLNRENKKCLLIGVTYALLDLIESHSFQFQNTIVMETGGMKGRREEMTKTELHERLIAGFGVSEIHSEYGMTELLSQGYSLGGEWFSFPKWMKCFLRPVNDPLSIMDKSEKTGGVNIIDLANIYSCSFIATQDLGRIQNNQLKIMGRFDHSDTRGCNLLVD